MNNTSIATNLAAVRQRITDACARFGRDPDDVRLLAVSKTRPVTLIEAAIDVGQHDFGENYLQDALEKIQTIDRPGIVWHFIGAIQSNKTRAIAENFEWIHTVANTKVARRLSDQAPAPRQILLQVNISGEAQKAGVAPAELPPLIESMLGLPNLAIRGLMTLPAPGEDFEAQRRPFNRLRELLDTTRERFGNDLEGFDQLSMGMTADMEAAIAEGATWIRIGTAIFGPRGNQPSVETL